MLSLPKRAHVDWKWPVSRKNAFALAYYGSCRHLVMGPCYYSGTGLMY